MALISPVLLFALLALSPTSHATPQYAELVLDAHSGRIVHVLNGDARAHPASLTKIMTLYMVFDALRDGRLTMDQQIPISSRAASMPPSKLGLSVGDTIRVEDAILSLVTKSANDIAVALAEAVAGSESEFGRRMTALAQQSLDMPNTVFVNASGLPDSRQITTARDMVNLAIRIRAHFPDYYAYFSTRSFTYRGAAHQNHNKLLGQYSGADGIKTGYINASGFNLVASAERDGRRVFGVVLGGSSGQARDARMMELLDYGFAHLPPMPVRPAFAPDRGNAGPTIAALSQPAVTVADVTIVSSTIADLIEDSTLRARDFSTVRVAQLRTYARQDLTQTGSAAATGASSVPLPVVLAALDPTKVDFDAAAPVGGGSRCASGWAVQVGAFGRADSARSAAAGALARSNGVLDTAAVMIDEISAGGQTLYRALLVGLADQSSASAACDRLYGQGIDCLAVGPNGLGEIGACS